MALLIEINSGTSGTQLVGSSDSIPLIQLLRQDDENIVTYFLALKSPL